MKRPLYDDFVAVLEIALRNLRIDSFKDCTNDVGTKMS